MASSPAVVGDVLVVHGMDGVVRVLDRRNGRERFAYRIGSPIESSPIVRDGIDYFGAWNGDVYALDLRTRRLRWTYRSGYKITSSAAIAAGTLYIGDYGGRLLALAPVTGALRWSAGVNGRIYGTPAVWAGKVFVPSSDGGSLTAFTTGGRYLWRVYTGAYVYSSPAVWKGRVFFGSYNGLLYCVSAKTGGIQWTVPTGGPVSGAAAVVDGVAYAGSFAHRIVGCRRAHRQGADDVPARRVRPCLRQRWTPAPARVLAGVRGRAGPAARSPLRGTAGEAAGPAKDAATLERGPCPSGPARTAMRLAPAAAVAAAALVAAVPAGSAAKPTPAQLVQRGLKAAVASGRLDPADAAAYRRTLAAARAAEKTLPPLRVELLDAVIGDVAAQWRRYTRPQALTLFSTLAVNIDWLSHHRITAAKPDIEGDDGAVYRFFDGHGYVFHPLANAAKLNALAASRNSEGTARLADALVARGIPSGSALLWEYEFPFASGKAPWTSGMAQAVLAQAFVRAGELLGDPALRTEADRAYAAVAHLLSPSSPAKPWIALYSFDRSPVLNAQLQTAISIADYAASAERPAAAAFAARMTAAAKTLLPKFDTGYWSLYSLKGDESSIGYHDYVIDLLRKLSVRTGDPTWRDQAERFQEYEAQPPEVRLGPPPPTLYPRPADGYRDEAAVKFWLSKRSTVTLLVNGERLTETLGHGDNTLSWDATDADPGEYHPILTVVGPAGKKVEQALAPFTVAPEPGPPPLEVQVGAPATLSWASTAEGTPWLHLVVHLFRGKDEKTIDLGNRGLAGTRHLRLPPGRWHASLVAANSAGRARFVSLGYLPR